jgi:basic membrane protein A
MNCLAPGSVLTSMVKRVDTQTYELIKSVADGTFKGGAVKFYGLAEDGVEAAMDQCNKGLISDAVLKEVDDLKAKLLSGAIVVPNYFDLKPGQKQMGTPPIDTPPSLANATSLAK